MLFWWINLAEDFRVKECGESSLMLYSKYWVRGGVVVSGLCWHE